MNVLYPIRSMYEYRNPLCQQVCNEMITGSGLQGLGVAVSIKGYGRVAHLADRRERQILPS